MKQKVTINKGGQWQKNKPKEDPVLKDQTVDFATDHANKEKERQKEVKTDDRNDKHSTGKG